MEERDYKQSKPAQINVNLCSFWFWLEAAAEKAVESCLLAQEDIGFEIYLEIDQTRTWAESLRRKQYYLPWAMKTLPAACAETVLLKKGNSIHLGDPAAIPLLSYRALGEDLLCIAEQIGISEFTIHPSNMSTERWDKLLEVLPVDITISVENMEGLSAHGNTLREIEQLLLRYENLGVTFDICHYLQNPLSISDLSLTDFLDQWAPRVSKLHFSVPSSIHPFYQSPPESSSKHFLASGSGTMLPEALLTRLSRFTVIVIEGIIPVHKESLLAAEAELLKGWLTGR